jgi:hypothetical protein
MNPQLEQFLRKATRGLLGRERETVREELRSNIEQLTLEYQEEGNSQEVALARAINEFGNPQTISVGMTRVHNIPKIVQRISLMAVLVAFFITPFGSQHASVLATPWIDDRGTVQTFTVPISGLEASLTRAGLRVKSSADTSGITLEIGDEWTYVSMIEGSVEVHDLLSGLCRTGFPVGIETKANQVALLFGKNRIELKTPSESTQAWIKQRGVIRDTLITDCFDVYLKL